MLRLGCDADKEDTVTIRVSVILHRGQIKGSVDRVRISSSDWGMVDNADVNRRSVIRPTKVANLVRETIRADVAAIGGIAVNAITGSSERTVQWLR